MIDDYGYINARIRAYKSRLLGVDVYEELLRASSVEDVARALRETPYGEDLVRIGEELDPEDRIQRALHRNLSRTYRKIIAFSGGRPRELLEVVFGRYDVHNLLSILRGKILGIGPSEIRLSLLPAGVLDPTRLEDLLARETARDVLEVLATWNLTLPFRLTREVFKASEAGRVDLLEQHLVSGYVAWASERLATRDPNAGLVRHILELWIDVRNILGVLLFVRDGLRPAGRMVWLEGGHLSAARRRRLLAAQSFEDVRNALRGTAFGDAVPGGLSPVDLPSVERRLEERMIRHALEARKTDPLGIGIPLSYIYAKDNEVTNLRMITYGKAFGFGAREIREYLVLPETETV